MGSIPDTDLEKYSKREGIPQETLDKESWNEENRPEPTNPQPEQKE